jgi:hypothetical protein
LDVLDTTTVATTVLEAAYEATDDGTMDTVELGITDVVNERATTSVDDGTDDTVVMLTMLAVAAGTYVTTSVAITLLLDDVLTSADVVTVGTTVATELAVTVETYVDAAV